MTIVAPPRLRTVTLDPFAGDWSRFVSGASASGVFHHPAWLALLHAQYRYPFTAECVVDEGGRIVAGLPLAHVSSRLTGRRKIAVPFSDRCPILCADDCPDDAAATLARGLADAHLEHGLDVEIRDAVPGWPARGESFYHHVIPLEADLDAVRRMLRANVRRDVNRAAREGVRVRRGTAKSDLAAFYRLHLHTRRRQGVPTQPWSFIRRLHELFDAGMGFVVLATVDGAPVAGAVYLHHGTTLTYKYGASETEHLRLRPNHAVFMEAIRWGAEHGMTELDLGRTDRGNEGLRSFKRGWGGVEHELTYARLSRSAAADPSPATPSLAAKIITRSPPVVGRVIGSAAYRHFA